MNTFHAFVKAFTNAGTYSKPPTFAYIFVCLAHFTLFVYKSLIMVVENFQKYHWIQHENTQPVVVMRERNKYYETNYYDRAKQKFDHF